MGIVGCISLFVSGIAIGMLIQGRETMKVMDSHIKFLRELDQQHQFNLRTLEAKVALLEGGRICGPEGI